MSYFKWKFTQFKVIKFFWLTGLPFFKIRKKFDPRYSLGLGFTQFTKYLGFEPNDGEYKVMGLASYGAPVYDLDKIFGFYNGIPSKKITSYIHWNKKSRHFLDFFSIDYRLPESAITSFHQNVAASVQHNLEKSVLNFLKINLQKFRKKNLVISGGVGLNVKLNMCLRTDLDLEGLYVQPVSSDSGLSLGTAGAAYKILTNRNPKILNSLHLGPDISEFPISRFYENKLTITEITDSDELLTFVASEISMGAVIAWMQGRMEFGPRSLGARSILADPRRIENRDKVNAKIKFREQFRPFCPSMLKEDFLGYIESSSKWRISKSLPFMIDAFRANEKAKIEIPAVVHVDGTFRPQVLDEDTHPGSEQAIINLLKKFKDLTGVGVLLNTSLNRRGEPIACNPDQGVDILMNTELDFLVIGNKIIKRNPLINSIK
jgi:carbamoyltransferase